MQQSFVSRSAVELLGLDDRTVRLTVVGSSAVHVEPEPGSSPIGATPSPSSKPTASSVPAGCRALAKGDVAFLHPQQHFYLTLSLTTSKALTILAKTSAPRPAPRPAPALPPSAVLSAPLPVLSPQPASTSSGAAAGQLHRRQWEEGSDRYGWSIGAYPSDKRARVRDEHGDTVDDAFPAPASSQHSASSTSSSSSSSSRPSYKQSTLSFASPPSSAASASSRIPDAATALTFDPSTPGYERLAFPCLCLSDAFLEPDTAMEAAAHAVRTFLSSHAWPSLQLVWAEDSAAQYQLILAYLRQRHPDLLPSSSPAPADALSHRFALLCSSLAALPEAHRCAAVANSTDWKWASTGDLKRRALNAACGEKLTELTEAAVGAGVVGRVGEAYAVRLTEPCALTDRGVRVVLQVVPPTFNPDRTDFVGGASKDGNDARVQLLRDTYTRMFTVWCDLIHPPTTRRSLRHEHIDVADGEDNAVASQRSTQSSDSTSHPVREGLLESLALLSPLPAYAYPSEAWSSSPPGASQMSLSGYLRWPLPGSLAHAVYCEDRACVVIYDRYPKARVHLLLLSKHQPPLRSIADVDSASAHVVSELKDRADAIAAHLVDQLRLPLSTSLLSGFHAIPSLTPLHLHLVSSDFDSACLKHKKHWNSFTTAFFVPPDDVLRDVRNSGRVSVDKDRMAALLRAPLRCCRRGCNVAIATMPALKRHIATCKGSREAAHRDALYG